MLEIATIVEQYRSFEFRVGRLMQDICVPFCMACRTPCCRVGICREAHESPFLHAVHGAIIDFDERHGYLSGNGCKLTSGRPPVCHAYICHRILAGQADDVRRYAIECLGNLVGFIGKRAWNGRHLVEALTDDDLRKVNNRQFSQQLQIAETALPILEAILHHGILEDQAMSALDRIRKFPST
ncbi:MAG: hypothetical protein WCO57_03550 [Verrucomicrobiota bacterium]